MKRRDFLTKGLKIITVGTSIGVISSIESSAKVSKFCLENLNRFDVVDLPHKPVPYEDVIHLSYTKEDKPLHVKSNELINGQYKEVFIDMPGEYQLQYTGEEYGWALV